MQFSDKARPSGVHSLGYRCCRQFRLSSTPSFEFSCVFVPLSRTLLLPLPLSGHLLDIRSQSLQAGECDSILRTGQTHCDYVLSSNVVRLGSVRFGGWFTCITVPEMFAFRGFQYIKFRQGGPSASFSMEPSFVGAVTTYYVSSIDLVAVGRAVVIFVSFGEQLVVPMSDVASIFNLYSLYVRHFRFFTRQNGVVPGAHTIDFIFLTTVSFSSGLWGS